MSNNGNTLKKGNYLLKFSGILWIIHLVLFLDLFKFVQNQSGADTCREQWTSN